MIRAWSFSEMDLQFMKPDGIKPYFRYGRVGIMRINPRQELFISRKTFLINRHGI